MTDRKSSPPSLSLADRTYRWLLRAYPRRFHDRFGVGMQYAFTHRYRDVQGSRPTRVTWFWLTTAAHVLFYGLSERLREMHKVLWPATRPGGHAAPTRTRSFGARIMRIIDNVRRDVVQSARTIARHPGMAVLAITTFALGVAASSALFSVVDSVMLRPLPYPDPEAIVSVYPTNPDLLGHPTLGDIAERGTFSWPEFADVRENQRAFESIAALSLGAATVAGEGPPQRIVAGRTTYELFSILGAAPLIGRLFTPDDDNRTGDRVLILQAGYWRDRFGADPAVVGRTVRVNDESHTIVGVLPTSFRLAGYDDARVWLPLAGTASDGNRGNHSNMRAIGRLAEGRTMAQARDDVRQILEAVTPPEHGVHGANVFPRHQEETRNVRPALMVLVVASLVLLVVACGNVAALLLGAGMARERELAVRGALGASRGRIAQQLLTESLLIAGIGAIVAVGIAGLATNALLFLAPEGIPRLHEAGLNPRVVAFTVLVSLASGILFGQIPALSLSKADAAQSLRSSRGAIQGRGRLQSAVVIGELALATVLLVSGLLFTRTLVELNRVDLGFDPDGLLTVRVAVPFQRFTGDDRSAGMDAYFRQMTDRIATVPGVLDVAVTSNLPLSRDRGNNSVVPQGWDEDRDGALVAERRFVSVNFFDVMRNPVVEGRPFDARDDRSDAARSVIVSETLANRAWPNETAVGKNLRFWDRDYTVVGVARDVRDEGLTTTTELAFYAPARQMGAQTGALLVRTAGDPMAIVPVVRESIWNVHPDLPITSTVPMTELMSASIGTQRYRARLMAVFAILAGVFAVMGIYGVTSRTVAHRVREMGIRVALGAERRQVVWLVVRQGLRLAGVGVALGILISIAAGRLLASMLFGVSTVDPVTLIGIALLVTGAAVVASVPPSYRATRADPMLALRAE